jgi:hypothetical protein
VRELLFGLGELVLGMAVGAAGSRRGGLWFGVALLLGVAVCAAVDPYVATAVSTCSEGEDCDPVTWADWALLGAGMVGFWLLAVAMGFAVADRFRGTPA